MYLTQSLHRATQQYPDRLASIFGERRRTYGEVEDRVARLAGALSGLGLRAGERVAILAANSDDYIEAYLGVWWAGGVINPVNTRWSAKEIVYSLDDCEASVLIVDAHFIPMLATLKEEASSLRHFVFMGPGAVPEGMHSFDEMIASAERAEDAYRNGDDLAAVMYTGGTTGFPKGVMLSHTNIALPSLSSVTTQYGHGAMFLHVAPLFHAATLVYVVGQLLNAGSYAVLPSFDTVSVIDAIDRHRATDVFLVPAMIQMIVDHPECAKRDLSSLKTLWYGGSNISEALLERAMSALPGTGFAQLYGLTEMFVTALLAPRFHTAEGRRGGKLRAAGQATTISLIKVCDDQGAELPRGAVGEIRIAGPNVMQGYWNKPEESAAAITADGWLRTGDGGYMDGEGLIYIVDRLKDMIISGGENVYAAEVENAVAQHPAVATCAVIGIPSEKWGESVHAVIVLKPGSAPFPADELLTFCRALIAGYKCPRSVEFRSELPMSGAGKVTKNVLRSSYLSREVS